MKVETKVTEKVTKEEKVLTISESEFKEVVTKVAHGIITKHSESGLDPMLRLALTMETANFSAELQSALFDSKEE